MRVIVRVNGRQHLLDVHPSDSIANINRQVQRWINNNFPIGTVRSSSWKIDVDCFEKA